MITALIWRLFNARIGLGEVRIIFRKTPNICPVLVIAIPLCNGIARTV